jgi:NADPH:quinone reductase-like Zn-dependent oxidoreductase
MHVLPATMKAVVLRGHGGLDQLDYCEVPVPQPGPTDVLVRVHAAALNNTDVNTRVGWYSRSVHQSTGAATAASTLPSMHDGGWAGSPFQFPRIQGADACGWIVAAGAEVDARRLGERVVVDPVIRPADGSLQAMQYLGADLDGAFAEYVRVPARNAHGAGTVLTDAEWSAVPCAYSAALNMVSRARVQAGERVLVTGASGGVGSAGVQLAHARGARVVAIASSSKAAEVQALGAERVLDREADLVAALGRESIDVAVDVVGGPSFGGLLDVLRRGGRYAVAGAIAGPLV